MSVKQTEIFYIIGLALVKYFIVSFNPKNTQRKVLLLQGNEEM